MNHHGKFRTLGTPKTHEKMGSGSKFEKKKSITHFTKQSATLAPQKVPANAALVLLIASIIVAIVAVAIFIEIL